MSMMNGSLHSLPVALCGRGTGTFISDPEPTNLAKIYIFATSKITAFSLPIYRPCRPCRPCRLCALGHASIWSWVSGCWPVARLVNHAAGRRAIGLLQTRPHRSKYRLFNCLFTIECLGIKFARELYKPHGLLGFTLPPVVA